MTVTPAKNAEISPQRRQWIGISALLACLLVGGGIVWFFMFGASPRKRTVTVDPKTQSVGVEGRLPMDRSPRQMRGVHRIDGKTWAINSASGSLRVVKQTQGYQLNYGFTQGFVTPEQVSLYSALIRAQTDQAMAREWGISAEQVGQLKKVNFRETLLKPSEEDRGAMLALWTAYLASGEGQPRADAQKRLVEKLDAIAKAGLEPARKAFADKLDGAKKLLTAEQLQKLTGR